MLCICKISILQCQNLLPGATKFMSQNKIKILYIITKGVWGGAQKYVYSLATNLPKETHEGVVVCGEGEILKQKLESKGIRVIEILNLKRDISIVAEIKSFITLYKILKSEKADALHLNSPKAGGIGTVAGRLLRIPKIIYTAHGWTFNEKRALLSDIAIRFFSWITVVLCTNVIVIAKKEDQQALTMPFVSRKKVTLIHNGIEPIEFQERNTARMNLLPSLSKNYESDTLWIGTIAELHKNKAHAYLISALSKINHPFVCIIIGEGEERKNLENLIRIYRLEEKIFLVGFKDKAAQYLKAFDIFTLTSTKEGLPYGILEAGLASLPVVATRVGGIPDIIENNITGLLVSHENIHQTRDALEHLIENPEQRLELGKNLHEKVEKEFSLEQMLEKTIKLYN